MGGLSLEAATTGMVVVLAATMLVTLGGRARLIRAGSPSDGDLALYQVAMLAGGPARVSDTVLSYLAWSGLIEASEPTDRLARVTAPVTVSDLHPVESAVLTALDPRGVRPGSAMAAGRRAASRHVRGLEGMLVDSRWGRLIDLVTLVGCGGAAGLAGWWFRTGGDRSVIVPLLMLLALGYAGWWAAWGRPRLTRAGEERLIELRRRFDADLEVAAIGVTCLPLERAMLIIALYGRDALTGGLSGLRKVMTGNPSPVPVRSSLSS